MSAINRILLAVAVLALAACNKSNQAISNDDMSMGDPKAKVTVVEYASVACPICARFNNEVFPAFKKKYIDTGKVHYIAREATTGNPALAATGFLMARCAGKDKYFQVTDAVYRAQDEIYEPNSETIKPGVGRDILMKIGQAAGLSETQFNQCVADDNALKAFAERTEKSARAVNLKGTPTFIINGKEAAENYMSLEELDAAIQPLLK